MTKTFQDLGLPGELTEPLSKRGISEPFPIQAATIPDALRGIDICGRAPTGSGKTLAFGLAILARVEKAEPHRPRALVLAPTRELAQQIHDELRPLADGMDRRVLAVVGGVGYGPQRGGLRRGVDILVATPGRLEDLIQQGLLELGETNLAVIDEADRMADMGFLPAVRRILDATAPTRQTLLFSATLDSEIAALSQEYQSDPVRHEVAAAQSTTEDATHHFWLVDHDQRVERTADVISDSVKTIVFTRTRRGADRLARQLSKSGVKTAVMHGGRNQSQRTRALKAFSNGSAPALIATDVAARGIHVDAVSTVIHFDPAEGHKDYIHRSGRTGRAGATGTVVSLIKPDQKRSALRLQRRLSLPAGFGHPSDLTVAVAEEGNDGTAITSIYVGNLPWSTTADDLDRAFSRHGQVCKAVVAGRRGKSKGYGFIDMPEPAAQRAMESLNGKKLSGRPLVVRRARRGADRN